jgi:hypothetical protein
MRTRMLLPEISDVNPFLYQRLPSRLDSSCISRIPQILPLTLSAASRKPGKEVNGKVVSK